MPSHPIFDEVSFYRLATRQCVWQDGGRESVVRFFHGLARKALLEEWQSRDPDRIEAQDWGFSGVSNQEIHQFLLHGYRTAREVAATELPAERLHRLRPVRGVSVRGGVGAVPTPALVVIDFRSVLPPRRLEPLRAPAELFTGIGEYPGQRHVESFEVSLAGLSADRRCVTLIITRELVELLARILERPKPDSENTALEVLAEALRPQSLSREQNTEEELRRAFRLSGALALAAGLEGTTDSAGRLQLRVDLGRSCPTLEPSTWVVACHGG